MELPIRILFLCTGNSCRSIMAEALANHLGAGRVQAFSAGSHPAGEVNPHALAVLQEHGVPAGEPVSASWDAFDDTPLDLIITVCDAAAGESCPVWLGDIPRAHWAGLPDPAAVRGTAELTRTAFESTYQRLCKRLRTLLELPLERLSPHELARALGDDQ